MLLIAACIWKIYKNHYKCINITDNKYIKKVFFISVCLSVRLITLNLSTAYRLKIR